ncbi:MAG: flagellar biosynthetic protein FliR [Verrucomicrobia bacterium]|nr:flagellar biosynthetic protein FliR [Verrucomicrobiota bacterium]
MSYLDFYHKLLESAPMSVLNLFFLGLMRIGPIIAIAPFFGAKTPAPVKIAIATVFTLVFLPQMAMSATTFVPFNPAFLLLCAKELFIGFVLAFFATMPFYMAESSGVLIDFVRGSSSLQVTNPATQSQSSSLGILYNSILIVIFFQIDGPFYFYSSLIDSYSIIPPDGWFPASFFRFDHYFWEAVWGYTNRMVAVGIQLAAPSLLAVLMTEMFLGIANRLAPQVQIAFLGMSLKSLVGLALLCAGWFFILKQMSKQTFLWLTDLNVILQSIRG